jgi:tetratricopeptide (TPR) repeat protein
MLTDSGVSKSQLDERQWKDIVRWVGGLPLALQILNASLREGFCTPQELHTASRSTDAVAHLDGEFEVLVSEVPAGSIRGISMAFEISFEALQSQEAAMAAALQIARLSPVPIPDSLLSNIADRRILAQLKSRHWLLGDVEKRDNQVVGHWRMHRLTASFLRSRSNDISRELCDLAKAITAALSHPELLEQIPSSRLLSHILKVLSDFVQIGIDKLSPESLAAARDLIRAGTFFRMDSPESDDLRNWTASFAVRFGVDGEIVDRLEALWTDIDRESWHRLLAVVRALKESLAAVPLLIRLLQVRSPQLQRAALWIAGFHELQNELVIPLLDLLLADFPERALEEPSPLKTDIMEYWGSPDPFWELPASQEIRDMLESFARNDRFPAMIEAVKAKLSGSQPSDLLERRIDAYALCLRAHYTPLPFRAYSAGRWDPIEEIHLGSYSEFHTPAVRDVDEADFEPLVELILTAADENIVRHTVRRMVAFVVGANSLSRAAHGALDAGHPDRTLLIADQTLAVRKNFANGWWWRALALEEIGPKERLRDALAAYGRVVNLEPEFADARLRHASLALELGDFDRGLRSARILAKMEPDYGPAHYLQACALLNLERDEEALAAASEAVRLSPDDYQAWLFQALAYEQLDMPAEARIAAKKAADLDPQNPEPRECLDRLG